MMGKPLVVVIEQGHPLVARRPQSGVSGRGVAPDVSPVPDQLGAEGLGDLGRVVGGGVVDDDDLVGSAGLVVDASERPVEQPGSVVGGDHDRDRQPVVRLGLHLGAPQVDGCGLGEILVAHLEPGAIRITAAETRARSRGSIPPIRVRQRA